jgi:hypothetical protein
MGAPAPLWTPHRYAKDKLSMSHSDRTDAGELVESIPLTTEELQTVITCLRYVRTHNASFLDIRLNESQLFALEQVFVMALVDLREAAKRERADSS